MYIVYTEHMYFTVPYVQSWYSHTLCRMRLLVLSLPGSQCFKWEFCVQFA